MTRLLSYLKLPSEVTPFEATYLRRMNKIALGFFWLHPPVFVLVAYLSGTSKSVALALALAAMIGPMVAYFGMPDRPRLVSVIYGVTAMMMGGALVYVGQGPMQIEMHFYFFVLIALLAVFANPMVVLAAAVTVAIHHFVVWLVLPSGVFNYDASIWTVLVHAVFVVLESVAACFVARSFFDNVIGLEAIVAERTRLLDARNHDMTRILDNVAQGFVTVDIDGTLHEEWSRAFEQWFGVPSPGMKLWDVLFETEERRTWMKLGFDGLVDDIMPIELTIDQLPRRISKGERELEIDYRPIGEPANSLLVVVSDITAELARERAEHAQLEMISVVEKAFRDRSGFTAFVGETERLVSQLETMDATNEGEVKRLVHTLKGNCGMFGVTSVAERCHAIENAMQDSAQPCPSEARHELALVWRAFRARVERLLGTTNRAVTVEWDDYQAVLNAMSSPLPGWAVRVREWGRAPLRPRLEQCADYAYTLAERLGKANLDVEILDHDLRVAPELLTGVWSAFGHAVRNMVDHGVETAEARSAAGKPQNARIALETTSRNGELRIEISDDGAGIDWTAVANKARDLGLPIATQRDLEEALFASGLSTRSDVSETSGRGVGMDALRQACREVKGRVEVHSEAGNGTRITCVIPFETRPRRSSSMSKSRDIPVIQ